MKIKKVEVIPVKPNNGLIGFAHILFEEGLFLGSIGIFQKIDELALWKRKLVEILADLIGFKKANAFSYYHHYYLLHELNKKKKDAKDRRTFWG